MRTLYPTHRTRPAVDQAPEPPRKLPSWESLVTASPSLARFEVEATEAAGNRFSYWLHWVRTCNDFKSAIHVAAESTGSSFGDAMRVAVNRLAAAYDSAAKPTRCRR